MKKFEKFLFFYSIIATTILFVSFGLTYPNPINFISVILLTPIIFYFWVRLTSPQSVNVEKWSARFIIVIVILSVLGIYTHTLAVRIDSQYTDSLKSQLAQSLKKNEDLVQKENVPTPSPKATPEDLKTDDTSIADLISEPTPVAEGTRITLKQNLSSGNIYKEKDFNSTKVGVINQGITYPFIEKINGWYKIVISGNSTGWANQSDVNEVQ